MPECFYHYTPADTLKDIWEGHAYGKTGLIPLRRVLNLGMAKTFGLPKKAEEGAVYGLLDPLPRTWVEAEEYEGRSVLETIIGDKWGDDWALLKVTPPKDADIWVADYAPHFETGYNGRDDVKNPKTAEVKQRYWQSFTPFFNERAGEGYKLPEVICFSRIPPESVKVQEVLPRWKLQNRLRAGTNRPLVMPPRKPSEKDLMSFLGI